ncbi:MAG: RES family NAD+ phosphorylase [Gemmatimonadaceae bacterium]
MRRAVEFEVRPARLELWRAVEAQRVVSTMLLVDSSEEQLLLEDLLEESKPALPTAPRALHYLLLTPFRYAPAAYGSRFRRATDPGVFYGADAVRTACAELGYWRWRFLMDSPTLERLDPMPQTVFQAAAEGPAIDLRRRPFEAERERWTDPNDYSACQDLAARARAAGVLIIRYESVRDPAREGCSALLAPRAFARAQPLAAESWYLYVTRTRARWWQERIAGEPGAFDFDMRRWAVA